MTKIKKRLLQLQDLLAFEHLLIRMFQVSVAIVVVGVLMVLFL